MNKLTKFCKWENNPANPKSNLCLRIGTLEEYRETDNLELCDPLEGRQNYLFDFSGSDVPKSVLSMLGFHFEGTDNREFSRWRPPGQFKQYVKTLALSSDWKSSDSDFVPAVGCIPCEFTFPNSPVYCMSVTHGEVKSPFNSYDSYWSILQSDAPIFADRIAKAIKQKIKRHELSLYYGGDPERVYEGEFQIEVDARSFLYIKKRIFSIDVHREPIPTIGRILWAAPFSGPREHFHEQEYRFLFRIRSKHISLIVKNDPIYVTSQIVNDLIVAHGRIDVAYHSRDVFGGYC